MNCWKSINFTKEFGINRLYFLSFLIGLLSFIFLFVPLSSIHGTTHVNEFGIVPFVGLVILMPTIHSSMHILPLIMMNKRAKVYFNMKKSFIPTCKYQAKTFMSKPVSIMSAFAPTLFITIPGIFASMIFADYYVYILLLTAIHIGASFTDFLYILHVSKAPKRAYIESEHEGFAILVKAKG
ncbi:hypothetical protein CFK37_00930 [Virgibacillus phasianinus]|uniref:DUF3267 domain-containing protein n=1 Tax=Virgibacillus phasianinus TaxID=2017483 RepID=A0A220TYV9_9BACI|nr:DUF3267 domain-containing protein [Virgibacillus phasianinus]ASK60871.1 hypothetical protein CFK37_00930 [Virgibacillus phasianinus]